GIQIERDGSLVAMSPTQFVTEGGDRFELNGRDARLTDSFGTVSSYERVQAPNPASHQLKDLVGTYASDEAETVLTIAIERDSLVVRRRPDTTLKLTPVYNDAFSAPQLGLVIFRRDAAGRATDLSIAQDRVWDLR